MILTALVTSCDRSTNTDKGPDSPLGRTSAITLSQTDLPPLGMAETFGTFGGGAGVTNQGVLTVINGKLGTTGASTLITGFHSGASIYGETPLCVGNVKGGIFSDAPTGTAADFVVSQAVASDALNALNRLAALPGGTDPGAGLLGGLTLAPGLYKSASGTFELIGSDLTLDAQGNPDALWVFQMASSLTVGGPGAPRSVILANGAKAKNVYWQVGSFATINGAGGGTMVGTILSNEGIAFSTMDNVAITTLNGRALALNASVTMVNTVVNTPGYVGTPPVDSVIVHLNIRGTNAADVVAVTDTGFVNVVNNGGHVVATQTGKGVITITNNGAALTAVNSGGGTLCISSTATGIVTVTNSGKGKVQVIATGSEPITINHTGDDNLYYPVSSGIRKR